MTSMDRALVAPLVSRSIFEHLPDLGRRNDAQSSKLVQEGVLYLGNMRVLADPYTKLHTNQVDIRFEISALFAVMDANGAYLIEPAI